MKKLLAFTLILVLCLSVVLVACNDKDNDTKTLPAPADQLAAAKNAFEKTYTTDLIPEETDVDFTVPKSVPYGGLYSFPITWTVSDSRITVDNHSDSEYLINVPEESPAEIKYTLTATITADDGSKETVEFERTVPEFKLYDYDGYVKAAKNSTVNIDGIVTAILPKDNGASNSGIYMNTVDKDGNPNGGVYVYNPKASTSDLKIGMTVRVAGKKDLYNGTHEIVNARRFTILDKTIKTVNPVDYTEAYKNAKDLTDETLTGKQSMLVTIKGVDIREIGSDPTYYYFSLDGKKTYVRISSSSCPLTTAEQEAFTKTFTENKGSRADVTGIVTIFSGKFYLTPATVNVFTNIEKVNYTPEQKVDRAIKDLSIDTVIERSGDVTLADKSELHEDVTITWAFKEGTNPKTAVLKNNVITYKQGDEDENVELVATFKNDTVSKTANYVVSVKKLAEKDWKDAAFAIAEAKKLDGSTKEVSKEWYYIYGTIVDDPTADYCNFNFQVGEEKIVVYGLYAPNGTDRYGSKRQIAELPVKKGDVVYLYAQLQNYGGKLEIVNAILQNAPAPGSSKVNPLSVADAIAKCDALTTTGKDSEESFYIIGVVGDIYNTQYCNFYFVQDGVEKNLVVYGLYAENGKDRYGSKRDISDFPFKKGDVMVVKGNLQKYVKENDGVTTIILEITNAVLVSYTTAA